MTMSSLLADLRARSLIQELTNEELFCSLTPQDSFYLGFDPSADSLHIGHLCGIILVTRIAREGVQPILLFGGSTGTVGDPTGRSTERPMLSRGQIQANCAAQAKQVRSILSTIEVTPREVDNYDWTAPVSFLDFLQDVGTAITVNYMVAKDSVHSRMNSSDGISFTEFCYQLLQGFDFLHLRRTYNCKMQLGGSDQFGNMTTGLELIRKKQAGDAVVLCYPLLTDAAGRKFGKSEGNPIWLDPQKTSPYEFYQFLLNQDDSQAEVLLLKMSLQPLSSIEALIAEHRQAPEKRLAQKALARELCTLVHGEQALTQALAASEVLFGGSIDGLSEEVLCKIFKDVPSSEIPRTEISTLTISDLLARTVVKSKGEAKRLIESGGAYLNQIRISDGLQPVSVPGNIILLRSGKKTYHLVKVV